MSENDKALNEWLDNQQGRYKYSCNAAFEKFMCYLKEKQGWIEVSGDLILAKHGENRKSDDKKIKYYFDDLIPRFIQWYEASGVSHNSAVVWASMIKSFFLYHREPLQVQKRIRVEEVKKRYHAYTKDELISMVKVGDLEEKAVIMLGTQLGIRVGDFVQLKRAPLLEAYKNLGGEFPLEFEIETEKEGVVSLGHISKDVYDMLQLYWASAPNSVYAFPSNHGHICISEQRANDILKNCWSKAYPDRPEANVRFHELRSYKISALTNLGVNQWAIQKMTGKKVSPDIATYLTGVNFRELFKKGEQALTLTQTTNNGNHAAIEDLKKENQELRERVDNMEEIVKKVLKRLPAA